MAVFVELKLHQAVPNTILVNLEQIVSVSEFTEEVTHVKLSHGDVLNVTGPYSEVSRLVWNSKE